MPQDARLGGGILDAPLSAVYIAAQRQRPDGDALVVVGAGIGQDDQQPVIGPAPPHQPSHGPQGQTVPVPSGGHIVEDGVVLPRLVIVPQDAQHRAAADRAECRHPHGNAAALQTFRDEVRLRGQLLLLLVL